MTDKPRSVVTGGSGFLGSHVADALTAAGHSVTVFDVRPSPYLHSDQQMVVGDIADRGHLKDVFADNDHVFHFAGVADIADAQADPIVTASANVVGTVTALDAASTVGVGRFMFASTMYVYSQLGGFYRASKQAAEHFTDAFHLATGIEHTVLRFGTLYGPRSNRKNRMHRFIEQALTEGRIHYEGSGDEVREPIHVRDAADLTVQALQPRYANKHLILTGQKEYTLDRLVRTIAEIVERPVDVERQTTEYRDHYTYTPFSYRPVVAEKLTPERSIVLEQGIQDFMYEVEDYLRATDA